MSSRPHQLLSSSAVLLICFFLPAFAFAQIGAGSLTFSIDNATVQNGQSSGQTGTTVSPGTQLTAGVGVTGVTGNQGTTSVQCYANGTQVFSWNTAQNAQTNFNWTPTVAGTYVLYCSGTWSGQHVNGTVQTPSISVPGVPTTTITLTSSSNPAAYGSPVLLTAKVTSSDGTTPTGNVVLKTGSTSLGLTSLNAGSGALYSPNLPPGTYQIAASYGGDANHLGSNGALSSSEIINSGPPPTNVVLSAPHILSGDSVTANVYVASSPGMQPQGSVICSATGISPVSGTLGTNGTVAMVVSGLPVGNDAISCQFTSSNNSNTSTGTATVAVRSAGINPGGNMIEGREDQVAGVLLNGSILLAGGFTISENNTPTATTELYSLSNGATAGPMMNFARADAAGVAMGDGDVIVTGGLSSGNNPTASAEYYSSSSGAFVETGQMTTARFGHTATLLSPGSTGNSVVLIAGGQNSSGSILSSAELYNEVSESFIATPSMKCAHAFGAAVLLSDGTVLIAGGAGVNSTNGTTCAEVYNPTTNTFTAVGSMNTSRIGHTMTLLPDGTVLVAGGENGSFQAVSSVEIYNPSTSSFAQLSATMSTPRTKQAATLLGNGYVLIAGGESATNTSTAQLDLYNPGTQTFTSGGSMATPRGELTATVVGSDSVLLAGGVSGPGGSLASTEELYNFDIVSGYVDLKYVVVGVLYAPPGENSNVAYGVSATNSTSTSISADKATNTTISTMKSGGVGLGNINLGAMTGSMFSYTYDNDSTSTYAIEKSTNSLLTVGGPPNNNTIGIDHDYDLIFVWLNPALGLAFPATKSATGTNIIDWTGYKYRGCTATVTTNCDPDQVGFPDVIAVPVYCLKDPYASDCSNYLGPFSRSWDLSGAGSLTLTDFENILSQDVFYTNPNYNPQTDNLMTFAETGSAQFIPPVNGQGTSCYSSGATMNTTITGMTAITRTTMVGFGFDTMITGGFLANFAQDINLTHSTTWTEQNTNSTSTMQSSSASNSICPPAQGYNGPQTLDVWHDNLFGTYMFFGPTRPAVPVATPPATSIEASLPSLSFSTTAYGSNSPTQTVTVTNNTGVELVMSATSFVPFDNPITVSDGSFTITNSTCTPGLQLNAGGTCTFGVVFSPLLADLPAPGQTVINGTLIVAGVQVSSGSTNTLETLQIPVSGTGSR